MSDTRNYVERQDPPRSGGAPTSLPRNGVFQLTNECVLAIPLSACASRMTDAGLESEPAGVLSPGMRPDARFEDLSAVAVGARRG